MSLKVCDDDDDGDYDDRDKDDDDDDNNNDNNEIYRTFYDENDDDCECIAHDGYAL